MTDVDGIPDGVGMVVDTAVAVVFVCASFFFDDVVAAAVDDCVFGVDGAGGEE